ncbi:EscJ/YscJ/HrcJ family type III secretion inner membrane ring protein [Oxalobacteraceae bacterium CAVE-383]|nr:EscJ/YscJ/HrcJ family type III secretion inner membrane ring protein [Oxalobacteraceae bacterium CAVE-383]
MRMHFTNFVSLVLLLASLSACGNGTVALLSGLPEEDANMIVAALSQTGIVAGKIAAADNLIDIQVSDADQAAALAELHRRGLPRKNYASFGDIFKKDGIISTPLEEQARYIYALAQELEKTLSQLDDVVYVRVHPVLARKASLSGPAAAASAGVLIKHRPDADLTPLIPQIQALVAHSIPDLRVEQVSVIMVVAEERPYAGIPAGESAADAQAGLGERLDGWLIAGGIIGILAIAGAYALRKKYGRPRPPARLAPEALELNGQQDD